MIDDPLVEDKTFTMLQKPILDWYVKKTGQAPRDAVCVRYSGIWFMYSAQEGKWIIHPNKQDY